MDDLVQQRSAELIASDRVEGTAVYDRQGERLGSISHVMIGKRNGQAEYAVMSFGGFLGIGNDHYPIPWQMLNYDVEKGGYVVDLDKEKLAAAPRFSADLRPQYDRDYMSSLYGYYGIAPLF